MSHLRTPHPRISAKSGRPTANHARITTTTDLCSVVIAGIAEHRLPHIRLGLLQMQLKPPCVSCIALRRSCRCCSRIHGCRDIGCCCLRACSLHCTRSRRRSYLRMCVPPRSHRLDRPHKYFRTRDSAYCSYRCGLRYRKRYCSDIGHFGHRIRLCTYAW